MSYLHITNEDVDACLARLEQMTRDDEAVIARYKALPLPERRDVTGTHLLKAMFCVAVVLGLIFLYWRQ